MIKFPDRCAKQIRNSFELSQLDGVGMMEHEEHELQTMKETEKANALRKVAMNSNDTSHAELKAHTQQSRPPVNTSTTTQTDTVYHKIYTDDEMTEEVGKLKSQYQAQADKLREEAEVEHKVLENRHKQKISNLVNEHANDIAQLNSHHESKHHTAQALLQKTMNMKSDSQKQMFEHQTKLQEQRHQAEMAKQKKKFEAQLREGRRPVVEEPKEKRQITRSLAEAVQQNYTEGGGLSSTDVPMATAPPPMPPQKVEPKTTKTTGEEKISGASTKASDGVKFPHDDKVKGDPAKADAGVKSEPGSKPIPPKPSPHFTKGKSKADQSSSSSQPDNRKPDNVTTQKIEGKNRSWWSKQNIATVKAQAELRGKRFTDAQTKGEKGSYGNSPTPKFKKQDYLNELYKLLGI